MRLNFCVNKFKKIIIKERKENLLIVYDVIQADSSHQSDRLNNLGGVLIVIQPTGQV